MRGVDEVHEWCGESGRRAEAMMRCMNGAAGGGERRGEAGRQGEAPEAEAGGERRGGAATSGPRHGRAGTSDPVDPEDQIQASVMV